MARKKASAPPKNDFAPEEDLDISCFTSEPIITGDCITSFSFDDSNENIISEKHSSNTSSATANSTVDLNISSNAQDNASTTSSSDNRTVTTNKNILADNRKALIANGMAPPINGEYPDIKRTYMLRSSTVRKINELKSIHPEINTYVSTIVDIAIAHYYNHIINEGGKQ